MGLPPPLRSAAVGVGGWEFAPPPARHYGVSGEAGQPPPVTRIGQTLSAGVRLDMQHMSPTVRNPLIHAASVAPPLVKCEKSGVHVALWIRDRSRRMCAPMKSPDDGSVARSETGRDSQSQVFRASVNTELNKPGFKPYLGRMDTTSYGDSAARYSVTMGPGNC